MAKHFFYTYRGEGTTGSGVVTAASARRAFTIAQEGLREELGEEFYVKTFHLVDQENIMEPRDSNFTKCDKPGKETKCPTREEIVKELNQIKKRLLTLGLTNYFMIAVVIAHLAFLISLVNYCYF